MRRTCGGPVRPAPPCEHPAKAGTSASAATRSLTGSLPPDATERGLDELIGVVCSSAANHEDGVLYRRNVGCCVALEEQQIGLLSAFDTADSVKAMHGARAVGSCDLDGLKRRETGRNEKFDLALIGESGDDAGAGIGTFGKQSALRNEGAFEFHLGVEDVARYSCRQLAGVRTSLHVTVSGVVVEQRKLALVKRRSEPEARFHDGKGRGYGDVPSHQLADERRDARVVGLQRGPTLKERAERRAHVGYFSIDEIARLNDPVLEFVDSEICGLAHRDRAEMARDERTAGVRLHDRRFEFVASERQERLEGRRATARPEIII